jgi:hypothetical protein
MELDPYFPSAYGMAAICFALRKVRSWMIDRGQETAEAARLVRIATRLGQGDAAVL